MANDLTKLFESVSGAPLRAHRPAERANLRGEYVVVIAGTGERGPTGARSETAWVKGRVMTTEPDTTPRSRAPDPARDSARASARTRARTVAMPATLALPHGPLPLPAFLPDATLGVVRAVDSADLAACGIHAVVMNAYHLMQRPGSSTVQALGGLHRMAGWPRPIITDSGGFQAYSLIAPEPQISARSTITASRCGPKAPTAS